MKTRTRSLLVAAQMTALAAFAGGAAQGQNRRPPPTLPPQEQAPPAPALRPLSVPGMGTTTVTVHNETGSQVALYVTGDGRDVRIGSVAAHENQIVLLPERVVRGARDLMLSLHPEGGAELPGGPYPLHPGDRLFLTVPPSAGPPAHGPAVRS